MTVWVLGDQLDPSAAPLQSDDRVLMIEAHAFGDRLPYHPQKLALVFSAMRHFRDDLRERGYEVTYVEAETFDEGLDRYFDAAPGDDLVAMDPPSHGAGERLRELVSARGGSLTLVENDLFLTTPTDFDDWAGDADGYRQEHWYRHARRETGVLMDGDDPVGGEWNYDDRNRETPPEGWTPPEAPRFEPDETTREVIDFVRERYPDGWGSPEPFVWPVSREAARQALSHFVEVRLPEFGPYQDAMVDGEWALCHSLLSAAINLGLLHPREAVEAVEEAYERGDAPLNSAEGFVRQVLGWREFVRHVYRRSMPELAEANQLDQTEPLPEAYWTGETDMRCLSEAVGHVRDRGYAHHIERLMVLSNFALVYGVDPAELNRWFHLGFVDAFHWVTTPNVVAMGSFATDVLSSKPYASSGNYVNKMSDYCSSCPYAVSKTTGENACPFNALYWDFLKENEARLRGTGRMGLMYSHVDRKDDEEWDAIRARADEIRRMGRVGTL
ncbi:MULTISPECIES: cryptochrome/photolyase family protein [unclassified Haloferax]|uniref:cryptochrome/photolyase family protein n=1 Tax=Haloferax TaxID=2251 RepID=UPI0002B22E3A|nr:MULTISPECIES: cryptochrome/photolyase family protein [unclassified Haloferax]ELZ60234.1 cryptochrome/photolyase-related protein Phr3 [Haloferax sp. ATCC BAA-646]ELZ64446.1 cryptochrome/photolyase-related protein Phr3 [Haloferax sp. ATCC BAA-645]ELZ69719.1 cryptochrome/photolyase-related protein Phr3 [Haloferax sp. ATCC BAA-644]